MSSTAGDVGQAGVAGLGRKGLEPSYPFIFYPLCLFLQPKLLFFVSLSIFSFILLVVQLNFTVLE